MSAWGQKKDWAAIAAQQPTQQQQQQGTSGDGQLQQSVAPAMQRVSAASKSAPEQQRTELEIMKAESQKRVKHTNREQFENFVIAVKAILHQWTALNLVALYSDSPMRTEVLDALEHDIVEWFHQDGEIYSDELEDHFMDFFEEEVKNIDLEDGSMKEVSDLVHDVYLECAAGNFSRVGKLVDDARKYCSVDLARQYHVEQRLGKEQPEGVSGSEDDELMIDDDPNDEVAVFNKDERALSPARQHGSTGSVRNSGVSTASGGAKRRK